MGDVFAMTEVSVMLTVILQRLEAERGPRITHLTAARLHHEARPAPSKKVF